MYTMLSTRTDKFFTATFWFSLSLTFAAIYGFVALRQSFGGEYVVQDDARQHVFWMQRFVDPALFPNDWIADYMQSNAPNGYAALYHFMAVAGIDPLIFNKLLPPLLGAIATVYCFGVCTQLLPVPAAGFIASLLLNQCLWLKDDLVSATPRAFFYPLFLAFLYYLLKRSLLFCAVAIALMGLFYPPVLLLCAGLLILQLMRRENGRLRLSPHRFALLAVALATILPHALASSEFGPVISAADAKSMPEFLPGGRVSFFLDNPLSFWLDSDRSGLLPWPLSSLPPLLAAGLLLPVLLRIPCQFPLAKQASADIKLLPQIVLVSVSLFLAAHAVLFKLYLPSRYAAHSLRIVLAIASAIALTIVLDALLSGLFNKTGSHGEQTLQNGINWLLIFLLWSLLIFYPFLLKTFPKTNYKIGGLPPLYEFLQKQPKDSLIASVAPEANNIPTFSKRSILIGKEYALPYHVGYYREIRQRALNLIRAQYSPDLAEAKKLIQKYGIDFWLLDRAAFAPKYLDNDWLRQYQPATASAVATLERGTRPALAKVMDSCKVFETEGLVLLNASCIVKD